jgi:23S rRNA G2445 N2-methylase RlmL
MSRRRHQADSALPPCYAITLPGLESVAAQEIEADLRGEVKRTARGLVVFRLSDLDAALLHLRTTEDVYLFAWGTDRLTYKATDLDSIRHWTAREVDWENLFRIHHAIRPKPKGRPTYRLVTQMDGEHGYRRHDAGKALARGLEGKLPASWRPADENASVEIWLTIQEATAVCGVRLSDRVMRHRSYKIEHMPASLRPTVAAAMVRMAGAPPGAIVLDPMCGAGTVLAEQMQWFQRFRGVPFYVLGGDIDRSAVRAAAVNLRRLGQAFLGNWDAARLPLPGKCVDLVLSNPPFGKKISQPAKVRGLFKAMVREHDRVLRPGGQGVLLVSDFPALARAVRGVGWQARERLALRILGQPAVITVWRKPE